MEQILSSNGIVIGYQRSGAGKPLLLVHGTTADHRRWASITPHLEQYFTIYAMDRRGRGSSSDSPDYNLMSEAEDVAAVVEAACQQTGESVNLLGHSYGAACSLEAALRTDKINRLILYEPPIPTGLPMYPPGFPDKMQALVDQGECEAALVMFFREVVRMPEHEMESFRQLPIWKERVQLAPTIPREMIIDRAYRFNPGKFANLQTPTLLLLGSDSPPIFRQAIEALNAVLPNNHVVIMPGQGHIAMDTDPELFVREVLGFLQA